VAGTAVQRRLTWRLGRITRRVEQTPRVKTLTLAVPGWPSHQAGQHVDVRLTAPDGYQTERSYSIASPPETSDELELAIERLEDGEVSPYLVDVLTVGDQVEFRGPIGGYFIWNVAFDGPLVLVAGGSGIAPIMAMIRHRFARGSHVPTRLLYSSRSLEEVIYKSELDQFAGRGDGFEVFHTLTRAQPVGWSGYAKRIDRNMLRDVFFDPQERPLCMVCGPTALVETVANTLVELGHPADRVKTERFGPAGP
jgi:ferredoxin-NADP reductase